MAPERVLDSSPSLLPLFARAGASMIPGASRLPFVGGGGARSGSGGARSGSGAGAGSASASASRSGEIPELALALSPVSVDRQRLTAYSQVCGFALSDVLPPTYIHILAFPLHLSIMTDSSFPFPALGLVHVGNEITAHRPVRASDALSLRSWPTPIEPHPRGQQFSLRTEARVDEELVWEEVSTILKRGRGSGSPRSSAPAADSEPVPATATWKLRGDLGRRYAAVSGDVNPIHMHFLTAKLFGFPSAIAHGMWTKARCLAALEGRLPDAFEVAVSFKRPIVLPATVAFGEAPLHSQAGIRFGVRDAAKGTPHLDGTVKFA